MKILILNGSPRKSGMVASILRAFGNGASAKHDVEWIDVCDLHIHPCTGCMKCRFSKECVLTEDDAHKVARMISDADVLAVGTPTYWGNMNGILKILFDRIVPTFMGEKPNGIPVPLLKGKKALIVAACTTPWPFSVLAGQSRGAIRSVREILRYGGYKIAGTIEECGTQGKPQTPSKNIARAKHMGTRL